MLFLLFFQHNLFSEPLLSVNNSFIDGF